MNSNEYKAKIETIIRTLAKIGVAVLGIGFSEDDYIYGNSFLKEDGTANQRFVRCYLVESHIPPDARLQVIAIKTFSLEEYKKENFLKYQLEVLEFALICLFENGWGTSNPNKFIEFEPKIINNSLDKVPNTQANQSTVFGLGQEGKVVTQQALNVAKKVYKPDEEA